jgi:hypothetical protein
MPAEEIDTPFRVQHIECGCSSLPKELLFEWIDGDTVVKYEIPQYFEAHVTLDYLEILETRGADAAFRWAVVRAVGRAGWAAFRSPGMDTETFSKISNVILDRVRGAQSRGPKG